MKAAAWQQVDAHKTPKGGVLAPAVSDFGKMRQNISRCRQVTSTFILAVSPDGRPSARYFNRLLNCKFWQAVV